MLGMLGTLGLNAWLRAGREHGADEGPPRRYADTEPWLGRGLFVELQADVDGVVGVHRAGVEFDVLNLSLFIHDEGCAPRPLVVVSDHGVLLQNTVGSEDLAVHVAEEWERDADLLRERSVGWRTVDADSENFRVACFKLGQISLIGL
jgi:hypothetical protein